MWFYFVSLCILFTINTDIYIFIYIYNISYNKYYMGFENIQYKKVQCIEIVYTCTSIKIYFYLLVLIYYFVLRILPLTSSWSSLNRTSSLNWTCVLLIVDSPNTTQSIFQMFLRIKFRSWIYDYYFPFSIIYFPSSNTTYSISNGHLLSNCRRNKM